jgi:hypothetical protein
MTGRPQIHSSRKGEAYYFEGKETTSQTTTSTAQKKGEIDVTSTLFIVLLSLKWNSKVFEHQRLPPSSDLNQYDPEKPIIGLHIAHCFKTARNLTEHAR